MSFINDIKGKNTQLYPIVTIEPSTDEGSFIDKFNECIFLSTNNINLEFVHIYDAENSPFLEGKKHYFKPLLLNIPSIKQSIDIERKKFKISNVSLEVSNYEYQGKRFSDMFSDSSFINKRCSIQFVSPSTKYFSTIYKLWNNTVSFYQAHTGNHEGIDSNNDGIIDIPAGTAWGEGGTTYPQRNSNMAQIVFQGVIRKVSHDDEKVTIQLEDSTESKAHRSLPLEENYTPADNSVPEKNKNIPIPFVYGSVDRSPCLYSGLYDDEYDYFKLQRILIDTRKINAKLETTITIANKTVIETPLYISENEHSYNCASETNTSNDGTNFLDYSNNDPFIDLNFDPLIENTSKNGVARIRLLREPINAIAKYQPFISYDNGGITTNRFVPVEGNDGTVFPPVPPPSDNIFDNNINTYWTLLYYGLDSPEELVEPEGYNAAMFYNGNQLNEAEAAYASLIFPDLIANFNVSSKMFMNFRVQNIGGSAVGGQSPNLVISAWTGEQIPLHFDDTHSNILLNSANGMLVHSLHAGETIDYDSYSGNELFDGGIDITNILDTVEIPSSSLNFGVPWMSDSNLIGSGFVLIKDFKIRDISLYQEGVSEDLNKYDFYTNVEGRINTLSDNHNDSSQYFIQNPIDVLYDIYRKELDLKASDIEKNEYITARDSHSEWRFGFTITKKIDSSKLISDICTSTKSFAHFKNNGKLGFSTIKSKYFYDTDYLTAQTIKENETVNFAFKKTKPEEIYKKIVLRYNKSYIKDTYRDVLELGEGGDSFYGIESESDATYEFESDYIRDTQTAENLIEYLYEYYKNDHLIITLTLPIKYINLEVGDLLKFEDLLGGITAYGIDYTKLQLVNGQYYYPLFMITSVQKNIDSVKIECLQLHHLITLNPLNTNSYPDLGFETDELTIPTISNLYGTSIELQLDLFEWYMDNIEHLGIASEFAESFYIYLEMNNLLEAVFSFSIDYLFYQSTSALSSIYNFYLGEVLEPDLAFEIYFGQYSLPPYEPENGIYGGAVFKGWLYSSPSGYSLVYAYATTRDLFVYLVQGNSGYVYGGSHIATLYPSTNVDTLENATIDLLDTIYLDNHIIQAGFDIFNPQTHAFKIVICSVAGLQNMSNINLNTELFASSPNNVSSLGYIEFPNQIDIDTPSFEFYQYLPNTYFRGYGVSAGSKGDNGLKAIDAVRAASFLSDGSNDNIKTSDKDGNNTVDLLDIVEITSSIIED